ncbi:MAG: hypothetical protein PHU85_13655 [Phycisphaerae bacterium]|nr:hypothetical protein [Phycisphaerae bacterium]
MTKTLAAVAMAGCVVLVGSHAGAEPAGKEGCRIVRDGGNVELRSPFLAIRLNTTPRLSAEWWENRLTGDRISLGRGPELEVDVGESEKAAGKVEFEVVQPPDATDGDKPSAKAVFKLKAKEQALSATVTYQWDATQPVIRKTVEIVNDGDRELNRLLNVRLGAYRTDATPVGHARGFPVYLNGEFFMTLAHPSGWSTAAGKDVSLRQYPGTKLAAGKAFTCMETVYGVGAAKGAQGAFVAHVTSRMRRVVRGHDKPYAIFESFGGVPGKGFPGGPYEASEAYLLDNVAKVAEGQRDSGCHFDYYSTEFWHDVRGDLIQFDPGRFPNGYAKVKAELNKAGMLPALWIDSGGIPNWTLGGNPAVKPAMSNPNGGGFICRATEPAKSLYTKAFTHHIRENGVRLLKFDNMGPFPNEPVCNNPNHEHLPGLYSLEAIHNALIEFFRALDTESPDVLVMLYWHYKSPWWLLYADTLSEYVFDSFVHMEAASPSTQPAIYARDSVTQRADQALRDSGDIPLLGKDSLGIWLADWDWNSCVGKDRWQEGFVMDLCRGSLLAQVWTDRGWLTPPERAQMADFIALFKAQPNCFRNSRRIVGDPWKNEPYGYACTDGTRAFLAVNNACWKDSTVPLTLNSQWGLPNGKSWDIYRWHPSPARLTGAKPLFDDSASITLRPFEVVLLEVVPAGQPPSLKRELKAAPIPAGFAEPTKAIDLAKAVPPAVDPKQAAKTIWTPLEISKAVSTGGATLTTQKDDSILAGGKNPSNDVYTVTATTKLTGITAIQLEVLCDPSLPETGPGRAINGNFALLKCRVAAAPLGEKTDPTPVPLQNPKADFSQESYGGWPIAAAIDENPETGWSIDPEEGTRHVAIFETAKPVGFDNGTAFIFSLEQGDREHNIGRFRLSVTAAKPPIPLPEGYGGIGTGQDKTVGELPPAARGGTLVVIANRFVAGSPQATIGGQPASATPVWSEKATMYRSSWQAWRVPVGPSPKPRAIELGFKGKDGKAERLTLRAVFIPALPD